METSPDVAYWVGGALIAPLDYLDRETEDIADDADVARLDRRLGRCRRAPGGQLALVLLGVEERHVELVTGAVMRPRGLGVGRVHQDPEEVRRLADRRAVDGAEDRGVRAIRI